MARVGAVLLLAVGLLAMAGTVYAAPADEELIKARSEASVEGAGPTVLASAIAHAQRRILAEILEAAFSVSDVSSANSVLDAGALYIKSTQVIATSTEKGLTKAEVECLVRRKRLLSDAALLLLPQLPFVPTVLMVTAERVGEEPGSLAQDARSAAKLRGFFKGTDFELDDGQSLRKCHTDEQLLAAAQGDNELAVSIARERFADVFAIGLVQVSEDSGGVGGTVVACKANVTLRVFRGSDGKLLDAFAQQAIVHSAVGSGGGGQAVEDACDKVKKDLLVATVIAATSLRTTDDLVITVEDPGTKARFDALVKAMGSVEGAADVEALLYSDALARVRVSYGGHPGTFLRAVEGRRYEGEEFEVRRAVLRTITVRFVAQPAAPAPK